MGIGITYNSTNMLKKIDVSSLEAVLERSENETGILQQRVSENSYLISACPEGNFVIALKNGKISCDIQTNVAGPGFHKFCVDFFDMLTSGLKVSFKVCDETGYYESRDFGELKDNMIRLAKASAVSIS